MTTSIELLADRLAIVDTVVAYATAVDTRDWPAFEALFTADAVWDYRAGGERHAGPERIVARVRPSIERLDATQHLLTNHVVAVDGDTATHTCYYLAQHLRDGARFLVGGRYEDELRRVGGRWLIAARALFGTWSEGDVSVLRAD